MVERETTFDVRVWKVEKMDVANGTRYRFRWATAERRHVKTFATKALAESKRARLLTAARRGEAFDVRTGLPATDLQEHAGDQSWWDWMLTYVDTKWPTLSPNSRRSMVEALIDATMAMLTNGKGRPSDAELRTAMWQWAFHARKRAAGDPPEALTQAAGWLARNTRPLKDIGTSSVARAVLQSIASKKDGTTAAPTTIARKRAVLYNVLELAVEHEHFPVNPLDRLKWRPPKVNMAYDPRAVINPDQARALLDAVAHLAEPDETNRKKLGLARRGRRLVAFFGCLYYAGLRPSEALALTVDDLDLPKKKARDSDGWGQLYLRRSNAEVARTWTDSGRRDARQLKHRAEGHVRVVPCPPPLVDLLRRHLTDPGPGRDGRLFAGPHGGHLTNHTYTEVWEAARRNALTSGQVASGLAARPYDLRHTAVSTWLASGVDSAQVAEWAGHSIAVLHRVYAHVLPGRSTAARRQIEQVLGLVSEPSTE